MKKKFHKLSVQINPDFYIIGISSHENDYRLSWAINSQLQFKLSKTSDLNITSDKTGDINTFAVFSFTDENGLFRYDLISNRCHDGFLLPEYKNVDYFFLIHGEATQQETENLLIRLKQVEIITLAFSIDGLSSKSMEKLLF